MPITPPRQAPAIMPTRVSGSLGVLSGLIVEDGEECGRLAVFCDFILDVGDREGTEACDMHVVVGQ